MLENLLQKLDQHAISDTQFTLADLKMAFQQQERHVLLQNWMGELLGEMMRQCEILECQEDASLLREKPSTASLFVAANLFNCESMMPNFIFQLLRLVSLHEADRIRISIYESGSTDSTPRWLQFLQKLLEVMGVQSRIVVQGSLVWSKDVDRIVLLAQLRNAAMAPLHDWADSWQASKVVFINDVFFCTQHILRLLLHDADIACGMDFDFCMGCLPRSLQKEIMQRDLMERYHLPEALAFQLPKLKFLLRNWRTALPLERSWHLEVPMVFYDRWVAHDINGRNFLNAPPYVNDTHTADFLSNGFPVYVHSCWNGIVAITSQPFYSSLHHHPVRGALRRERGFLCRFAISGAVSRRMPGIGVLLSLPRLRPSALRSSCDRSRRPSRLRLPREHPPVRFSHGRAHALSAVVLGRRAASRHAAQQDSRSNSVLCPLGRMASQFRARLPDIRLLRTQLHGSCHGSIASLRPSRLVISLCPGVVSCT